MQDTQVPLHTSHDCERQGWTNERPVLTGSDQSEAAICVRRGSDELS